MLVYKQICILSQNTGYKGLAEARKYGEHEGQGIKSYTPDRGGQRGGYNRNFASGNAQSRGISICFIPVFILIFRSLTNGLFLPLLFLSIGLGCLFS